MAEGFRYNEQDGDLFSLTLILSPYLPLFYDLWRLQ